MVLGILAFGQMQKGVEVDLLKYCNGSVMSSNRDRLASPINFLDNGGALLMPENGKSSSQYFLLTHLCQYFAAHLRGTMQMNGVAFNSYQGDASEYQVHIFINLTKYEIDYFIAQVGLSATSGPE